MPRRKRVPADFVRRPALRLPAKAHYKHLLALPRGSDLGAALVDAMNAIEADFEPLLNQLPAITHSSNSPARDDDLWPTRDIGRARKALEVARGVAVDHLKQVRHFQRHADRRQQNLCHRLTELQLSAYAVSTTNW